MLLHGGPGLHVKFPRRKRTSNVTKLLFERGLHAPERSRAPLLSWSSEQWMRRAMETSAYFKLNVEAKSTIALAFSGDGRADARRPHRQGLQVRPRGHRCAARPRADAVDGEVPPARQPRARVGVARPDRADLGPAERARAPAPVLRLWSRALGSTRRASCSRSPRASASSCGGGSCRAGTAASSTRRPPAATAPARRTCSWTARMLRRIQAIRRQRAALCRRDQPGPPEPPPQIDPRRMHQPPTASC